MLRYRALLGPVAVLLLVGAAIFWSPFEPHRPPVSEAPGVPPSGAAEHEPAWADEEWAVFESKVRWAAERGLDTAAIGRAVAEIGRTFVGTAYVPRTLEAEGPERIVINFRGLDCVTFVETAFTLARFVREEGVRLLDSRRTAEARYAQLLAELRYRDGRLDGYASRLHYFSDWIADNARRGLLVDLGPELGARTDREPIDFMTTHPDAYRQLADPENVELVRETEDRLSRAGRTFVPQDEIEDVADRILDGDVIAATSTVEGLDVAHTGLALRVRGRLHLLHAPLVGDSVEISEVPLSDRIAGLSGQDGIMVARPVVR